MYEKDITIGLTTILTNNSYGAVMQCLATQKAFLKAGYKTVFLNTKVDFPVFRKNNTFSNIFRNVRDVPYSADIKEKYKRFDEFTEKYIDKTKRHYSYEELSDHPPEFDMFLTGSDQTFNLNLPVFSKTFYLDFIKNKPKFSYGSCFGEEISNFNNNQKEYMKKCLGDYDKISVRTKASRDFVKELTGIVPEIVLDPTLLLEYEDYKEYISEYCENENYILFYTIKGSAWLAEQVENISAKTGLKVICIHMKRPYEIGRGFKYIASAGPSEFLSLINNAKMVITSSFHATVFSMLFHKQFASYVFSRETGNRISSLLEGAGLDERLFIECGNAIGFDSYIDYKMVEEKINKLREPSYRFIKDTVKELSYNWK